MAAVVAEGVDPQEASVRRRLAALRFVGQDSTLAVEVEGGRSLSELFVARYRELFGHRPSYHFV